MNTSRISYAQNREDVILDAFFEKDEKGFYVDVGANHPVHESVTKLFYDKGWHGMNIEPTGWLYELLRLTRPRDINVQLGVSDKSGSMNFREYLNGNGLSTFSAEMQEGYTQNDGYFTHEYREYQVPVKTLAQIFKEHKVSRIDFMKVDIEGYEYEALAGNDWKEYRPKVLCIEANHIIKDWHNLIKKAGYNLAFFDGLNEYFVADEESARIKNFSYPDRVLLGEPYVSWTDYKARQDLQRDIAILQDEIEVAKNVPPVLTTLQPKIRSSKDRLKSHVRRLDAVIESSLSPAHDIVRTDQKLPPIHSADDFSVALIDQLRTRPKQSQARKATRMAYRSLKKGSKKIVRKVIR